MIQLRIGQNKRSGFQIARLVDLPDLLGFRGKQRHLHRLLVRQAEIVPADPVIELLRSRRRRSVIVSCAIRDLLICQL